MSGVLIQGSHGERSDIGNMNDFVNNRATLVAYKESCKDAPGFFSGFAEEMTQLVADLTRDNLQKLSLFSYSMMMRAIGRSPDVIEIDLLISTKRCVLRIKTPSNDDASLKLDPIVYKILRRVCRILARTFHFVGRYRLLFMSFDSYSYNASRWPVLPWEWLKRGGRLSRALHAMDWEENTRKGGALTRSMAPGWACLLKYFGAQLSFRCDMSKGYDTEKRVCMRHPDTVLNTGEVTPIASLIRMARECGMPDAVWSTPRSVLCDTIQRYQPVSVAIDLFLTYFREELLESLQPQPRYFMALKGGYNLKLLLENKFGFYHRIFTTDMDFVISSHHAKWGMDRIIRFWEEKISDFINLTSETKKLFTVQTTPIPNPKEREHLVLIVQIKYNGSEFIDLSFIESDLPTHKLDIRLSKKLGIPVRKWSFAVMDLFDLVVRSNYPGLDPRTYERRNPIHRTALNRTKGIRDLYRARTVCEAMRKHPELRVDHQKELNRLCAMIANKLTLARLTALTEKRRRAFFARLARAVGYIF